MACNSALLLLGKRWRSPSHRSCLTMSDSSNAFITRCDGVIRASVRKYACLFSRGFGERGQFIYSVLIVAGSRAFARHHPSYAIGEISLGLISLRPPQKTLV